jgi:hypothetical protein
LLGRACKGRGSAPTNSLTAISDAGSDETKSGPASPTSASVGAVCEFRKRYGVWTNEEIERIKVLRNRGFSSAQIYSAVEIMKESEDSLLMLERIMTNEKFAVQGSLVAKILQLPGKAADTKAPLNRSAKKGKSAGKRAGAGGEGDDDECADEFLTAPSKYPSAEDLKFIWYFDEFLKKCDESAELRRLQLLQLVEQRKQQKAAAAASSQSQDEENNRDTSD